MRPDQNSRTAIVTASMRAAHLIYDNPPFLLEDTLALSLAGFNTREDLINLFSTREPVGFMENRAYFALRHRYVEDELDVAVNQADIKQYIILGSGLDSFAYRNDIDQRQIKVIEVDHPASLKWKRTRLKELSVPIPQNISYIPVDFNSESIVNALNNDKDIYQNPVFVSWLGVSLYLTPESVFSFLADLIQGLKPGSVLVFDYVLDADHYDQSDRKIVDYLSQASANVGEPWLSRFDPTDLERRLKQIGFSTCHHFTRSMAMDKYFKGRDDTLRLPGYPQLVKAIV